MKFTINDIEVKYLYFEWYKIIDNNKNSEYSRIQNSNILVFKPNYTNSNGICGCLNLTKQHNKDRIVEQYWIDFDKYKSNLKTDTYIIEAISQIKSRIIE